jgi:hypothetical protein
MFIHSLTPSRVLDYLMTLFQLQRLCSGMRYGDGNEWWVGKN